MVGDTRIGDENHVSACCQAPFVTLEDRETTHEGAGERWSTRYQCTACHQECSITVPGSGISFFGSSGMTGEAMLDALDAAGSGWIRDALKDDDA